MGRKMDWYALFVESNSEESVQQWLHYYFDESILRSIVPKRMLIERQGGVVHRVIKILFPGYVLINTEMNETIYHKIKNIPKAICILKVGTYCSKIGKEEIEPILKLIGDGEVVDYSKVYIENTNIIVKSGPLQGLEGIICKVDKRKKRAKILLNFMSSQKIIDVGIEILENDIQ
jgi:transcriptional antiterminator NusG